MHDGVVGCELHEPWPRWRAAPRGRTRARRGGAATGGQKRCAARGERRRSSPGRHKEARRQLSSSWAWPEWTATTTTEAEEGGDPARQRGSEVRGVVAVIVVEDEGASWTQADGGRPLVATRTARPCRRLRLAGAARQIWGRGREEWGSQVASESGRGRGRGAMGRWRPYPHLGADGEVGSAGTRLGRARGRVNREDDRGGRWAGPGRVGRGLFPFFVFS